jgi:hypothetical protein
MEMNRKIVARIAAVVSRPAALLIVGTGVYRAGQRSDRTVEVVGEGSGRTVLVQADGWDGPGPGFLLFPLIVIGLFLLFASRRGRWRGPRGYGDDDMREWHRRQHGDEPATPTN